MLVDTVTGTRWDRVGVLVMTRKLRPKSTHRDFHNILKRLGVEGTGMSFYCHEKKTSTVHGINFINKSSGIVSPTIHLFRRGRGLSIRFSGWYQL